MKIEISTAGSSHFTGYFGGVAEWHPGAREKCSHPQCVQDLIGYREIAEALRDGRSSLLRDGMSPKARAVFDDIGASTKALEQDMTEPRLVASVDVGS